MVHVWRSFSTCKKCAFELEQGVLVKIGDLLISFYVFVRPMCKECSSVVGLKTQLR